MTKKSTEDYLRTIYYFYEQLDDKTKGVRSSDVANELNISKPSVSSMIRKMAKQNLLIVEPYSKIKFTKKGLKQAKKNMFKHRVIEVFLQETLRFKVSQVHEMAHKLEHAFSDEAILRLHEHLGKPKKAPSGRKIPSI